jgi:hypothetical protein
MKIKLLGALLVGALLSATPAMAQAVIDIANEAGTGTTINKLAKLTGAPSTAIIAATTDVDDIAGIVYAGAGTTGNALVAKIGKVNCVFDATAITAGHYVTNSATTAGACHDAGATRPASSQVIGRALATAAGSSTVTVDLSLGAPSSAVVASGTSALGTGAITSATCATVVTTSATGAASTDVVVASFNGDPTGVTGYIPATAGMLTIIAYPTSNNVNFKVCNNTSSSVTPGAITLNWRVVR